MSKISVIILNWKRPNNLLYNMNFYSYYHLIDEIIVFNNNPNYRFSGVTNNKVTIIESSRDLGLYTRFAAAGLARNECILLCDDDLFIPEYTISELHKRWLKSPNVCHGTQGRVAINDYNMNERFGAVQVILTRCVLASKQNCLSAFQFSLNFQDMYCEPKGNGEDIILSFISMYYSGKLNQSYDLPYINYSDNNQAGAPPIAINKRWEHHVKHRSAIVKRCKELLGEKLPF